MSHKKPSILFALFTLVLTATVTLALNTPAQAQVQPVPTIEENNCIRCHEDLYFLHDTGKWFCIRESPMTCANCHEGDPNGMTKEIAHTNLKTYPIINSDASKCQECHPEKSDERVEMFDEAAGIGLILVAAPYTPVLNVENSAVTPVEIQQQESSAWINEREILPIILVMGTALTGYIIYRIHHRVRRKL